METNPCVKAWGEETGWDALHVFQPTESIMAVNENFATQIRYRVGSTEDIYFLERYLGGG